MFVAAMRCKIKRKGKTVWVERGDPVPEAENWPDQQMWINAGYVRFVDRPEPIKSDSEKAPLPSLQERKRFGKEKHYRSKKNVSANVGD